LTTRRHAVWFHSTWLLFSPEHDQRGCSFIDQDIIHLINDGVMVSALGFLVGVGVPGCPAGNRSRIRCSFHM